MKKTNLLIGIWSLVLASCADKQPQIDYTGFVDKQIFLIGMDSHYDGKDTIALLSMKIPKRLDTFYRWYHGSCNPQVSYLKYRFADKRYTQFSEGGFYWTFVADSIWQLSVWHRPVRFYRDSTQLKELTIKDSNHTSSYYSGVAPFDDRQLIQKSFLIINGRAFFIDYFKTSYGYLTEKETIFVVGMTNLRDRHISFVGECSARDTAGFVSDLYKTFASIQIDEQFK